jgi:hypothetical protein
MDSDEIAEILIDEVMANSTQLIPAVTGVDARIELALAKIFIPKMKEPLTGLGLSLSLPLSFLISPFLTLLLVVVVFLLLVVVLLLLLGAYGTRATTVMMMGWEDPYSTTEGEGGGDIEKCKYGGLRGVEMWEKVYDDEEEDGEEGDNSGNGSVVRKFGMKEHKDAVAKGKYCRAVRKASPAVAKIEKDKRI